VAHAERKWVENAASAKAAFTRAFDYFFGNCFLKTVFTPALGQGSPYRGIRLFFLIPIKIRDWFIKKMHHKVTKAQELPCREGLAMMASNGRSDSGAQKGRNPCLINNQTPKAHPK
jgi:hypothetical protein